MPLASRLVVVSSLFLTLCHFELHLIWLFTMYVAELLLNLHVHLVDALYIIGKGLVGTNPVRHQPTRMRTGAHRLAHRIQSSGISALLLRS